MAKELRCGDLMPGCDYVARADTEGDVLQKAAAHAREVHGLEKLDDDTVAKVKAAIHEA